MTLPHLPPPSKGSILFWLCAASLLTLGSFQETQITQPTLFSNLVQDFQQQQQSLYAVLEQSYNPAASYLECSTFASQLQCEKGQFTKEKRTCLWNYEQQECQMNLEDFQQFYEGCQSDYAWKMVDISNNFVQDNHTNVELLDYDDSGCYTLRLTQFCILDQHDNNNALYSKVCQMVNLNSTYQNFLRQLESGISQLSNIQSKDLRSSFHLKKDILASLLFPNVTNLQEEFVTVFGSENERQTNDDLKDSSQVVSDDQSSSGQQLGMINFFLYCGFMLLFLGISIGFCIMCNCFDLWNICHFTIQRSRDDQATRNLPASLIRPKVFQQQYSRFNMDGYASTTHGNSGNRNTVRGQTVRDFYLRRQDSSQQQQRYQPLLGRDRDRIQSVQRVTPVRTPIVISASNAASVSGRSLNEQLWWSGQVPLQSQSNTSALEQFISSLDAFIYHTPVLSEDNKEICTVCLEEVKEGDKVTGLPCCHVFHSGCIVKWIRTKGVSASCPVCNARLMDDFLTIV